MGRYGTARPWLARKKPYRQFFSEKHIIPVWHRASTDHNACMIIQEGRDFQLRMNNKPFVGEAPRLRPNPLTELTALP